MQHLMILLGLGIFLTSCADSTSNSPPAGSGPTVMLKLPTDEQIKDPSDEQILKVISSLVVGSDIDAFAILSRSEMTYVQTSGDQSTGFDMEYQDGDIQEHYRADRSDFSLEEIVKAFREYRDGVIDWSDYGNWTRITW